MKESTISVLLHTSDYRGDHAADVVIAHGLYEGETVADLIERLIPARSRDANGKPGDWIELRPLVLPTNDEKETGNA